MTAIKLYNEDNFFEIERGSKLCIERLAGPKSDDV